MKPELIETKHYLLAVSDEELTGLENNIWVIQGNRLFLWQNTMALVSSFKPKKIIAHRPLNGAPYLEGIDVLPPLKDEASRIVKQHLKLPDFKEDVYFSYENGKFNGAIYGYNLAKETYKYTEEVLRRAIEFGQGMELWKEEEQINNFIQSLNQPKLPFAFECGMESIECPDNIQGCLVAHFGQAKITNSDGRTEWVGNYIFN